MGLFSKKKKEQKTDLPPLKFPELPSVTNNEMPSYGSSMPETTAIKQAMAPGPQPEMPKAMPVEPPQLAPSPIARPEHQLFVKIDKYRDVVDTLGKIKVKLADANHVLSELSKLKAQEERELDAWHSDLSAIKQKLMMIDEKLFDQ